MTAGCPNRQRRHTPSSWTTPNPDTTLLGLYFQQPARSTSAEIVEKLNRQINAAVADPIIKARLVEQGGTVFSGSPADFEKLIADDTAKCAKVIRGANIKPE